MQQYTLAAATTSVPTMPIYSNNNHLQVQHTTSVTMATTHPCYIGSTEGLNMISHNSTPSHSLNCIAVSKRQKSYWKCTNRKKNRNRRWRSSSSMKNCCHCNSMKCSNSNSNKVMLDSSMKLWLESQPLEWPPHSTSL